MSEFKDKKKFLSKDDGRMYRWHAVSKSYDSEESLSVEEKNTVAVEESLNEKADNVSLENDSSVSLPENSDNVSDRKDFSGQNLDNHDFNNVSLKGALFSKTSLKNVDFSSMDLSDADFSGADLSGANLSGAVLKNVNFTGACLNGVQFSGADIEDALFLDVQIDQIALEDLQLLIEYLAKYFPHKLNLAKFNLTMLDLKKIDLHSVNLRGVDFTGVDFTGVNIIGLNLSECIITPQQIAQALGHVPNRAELAQLLAPRKKDAKSNSDTFSLRITPNAVMNNGDIAWIEIIAKSNGEYTKELRAEFKLVVGKENITYEIEDKVNRAYLELNITNTQSYYIVKEPFESYQKGQRIDVNVYLNLSEENKAKCYSGEITLKFDPKKVRIDMTDKNYINAINQKTTRINRILLCE